MFETALIIRDGVPLPVMALPQSVSASEQGLAVGTSNSPGILPAAAGDPRVRLLIADRHALFLEAMKALLRDDYLVACTRSADEPALLDEIERSTPHILIFGPRADGLDHAGVAHRIRKSWPHIKLVYLSDTCSPMLAADAFAAGASAFLLTQCSADAFRQGLHAVARGDRWLDQCLADGEIASLAEHRRLASPLSARELEVLGWVLRGWTMKQVARKLNISPRTVAFHKYRAMRLLDVRDNAQLMEAATRIGLMTHGPGAAQEAGN